MPSSPSPDDPSALTDADSVVLFILELGLPVYAWQWDFIIRFAEKVADAP